MIITKGCTRQLRFHTTASLLVSIGLSSKLRQNRVQHIVDPFKLHTSVSLLVHEERLPGSPYQSLCTDFARVLGPPNIAQLMTGLESNNFVRHFLLGNNMIGPVGARLISDFVLAHPNRMETWYLAGNCIDLAGFERLVSAWTTSTSITNIWLKRNPLRPKASTALHDLITRTPNLRTLDLDQTELGDEGVAHLFSLLANHHSPTSLRHIYLNAVGIGQSACQSLANYLSSPHCTLESMYLSTNAM